MECLKLIPARKVVQRLAITALIYPWIATHAAAGSGEMMFCPSDEEGTARHFLEIGDVRSTTLTALTSRLDQAGIYYQPFPDIPRVGNCERVPTTDGPPVFTLVIFPRVDGQRFVRHYMVISDGLSGNVAAIIERHSYDPPRLFPKWMDWLTLTKWRSLFW